MIAALTDFATLVLAVATVILAVATVILAAATRRQAQRTEEIAAANHRMTEVNRQMLTEMREGRQAQERPLVVVDLDYSQLPFLYIRANNLGKGAAADVKFAFRGRMDIPEQDIDETGASDLSELNIFFRGIGFLSPGAELPVRWGPARFVLRSFYDNKNDWTGVDVEVFYKSLDGIEYSDTWNINPVTLERLVERPRPSMSQLIGPLTKMAEKLSGAVDSKRRLRVLTATEHRKETEDSFKGMFPEPPQE